MRRCVSSGWQSPDRLIAPGLIWDPERGIDDPGHRPSLSSPESAEGPALLLNSANADQPFQTQWMDLRLSPVSASAAQYFPASGRLIYLLWCKW